MQAEIILSVWTAGCRIRRGGQMVIFDATWYVVEEVWAYEEGIQHPAAAVEADEGELVGQAYAEGDVVA
jgi:hypothetical protein